ncbi:MAG: glycosyltransferase family 4 protein [Bacteroidales bacterium]|nr:glycosyltransferase family 4 protein [Candidatus Sodaliphilus aphodohippi]
MTKVLEIINRPTSAINFIGDQFTYFAEKGGYEMHLICSPGDGIEEFAAKRGIHYHPVEIERRLRPMSDLKSFIAVARYIRQNHFDAVICHQEKSRLLGTLAAWLMRVPVRIIYMHGIIVDTMKGAKRKFFVHEGRLVGRLATNVVCVSPSVKKRRLEEKMDNPAKQAIIGHGTCNGIDTVNHFNPAHVTDSDRQAIRERYGIADGDFVVGFCGRIVRDKGIIELTDAVKLLRQRHPERNIRLFVIGKPEASNAVPEQTLQFLQESPAVVFTGAIPHSEIQKYYTVMNVFILPSYREGFGQVTLEANAMEIPAIVSRSTGCIDSIVDGETGLFADIEPNDLADKIEKFFDPDMARQMGINGRRIAAERYEHTIVVENTFNYIRSIIDKTK